MRRPMTPACWSRSATIRTTSSHLTCRRLHGTGQYKRPCRTKSAVRKFAEAASVPRRSDLLRAFRVLMVVGLVGFVHGGFRAERIVFIGDISSVVGSINELVLFALFPLGRFFALLILASQLLLPFLERCA